MKSYKKITIIFYWPNLTREALFDHSTKILIEIPRKRIKPLDCQGLSLT